MAEPTDKPTCRTGEALTRDQVTDYVSSSGTKCPYCKSPDIESGSLEADGSSAWAEVACQACTSRWRDVFVLKFIEPVK